MDVRDLSLQCRAAAEDTLLLIPLPTYSSYGAQPSATSTALTEDSADFTHSMHKIIMSGCTERRPGPLRPRSCRGRNKTLPQGRRPMKASRRGCTIPLPSAPTLCPVRSRYSFPELLISSCVSVATLISNLKKCKHCQQQLTILSNHAALTRAFFPRSLFPFRGALAQLVCCTLERGIRHIPSGISVT